VKTFIIIILLVLILAVVTKPTTDECKRQALDHLSVKETGGHFVGKLADELGLGNYAVTIEDRIFWQEIYEYNGKRLAFAGFGKIFYLD